MVWVRVSSLHRPVLRNFCHYKALSRSFSATISKHRGVVVGVYEEGEGIQLSQAGETINKQCGGQLQRQLKQAGRKLKAGKTRVLFGLDEAGFSSVAVVGVGKKGVGYNEQEQVEEGRERVRKAVANGVRQLSEVGEVNVDVDPCGDAEAAAEGALLSLFSYDELKAKDSRKPRVHTSCFTDHIQGDSTTTKESWQRGVTLAEGQNLARYLMEAPSNYMTPSIFARLAQDKLGQSQQCTVTVRNKAWAEEHKMESFLSVAKGSVEQPLFLEIDYQGGAPGDTPIALVGKGITFDSGGISLKPGADMDKMRADMGGAACVMGALLATSRLRLPVNIKGLIPLCENMPSSRALKPGDVVRAMNGKTIQVDNTDAEGRLILADALCYAETFNPSLILDLATLTGAVAVALGSGATAVYTNSTSMWDVIHKAGTRTGDRVWRMPLFKHYTNQVTHCDLADLNNIGKYSREGGSCTAAAFLKEFVTNKRWLHLDIAGVMMNKDEVPYLGKGMAGRPTRTLVEFLNTLSRQKLD
ncbi:cytosol aminopeptidase-like [Haliotis cracherodii]|uniref:cytosol aminopeptidase-like n=1 Tax=Haliotis cracherodii TaxID=6455 RepID=UPI0039EBECC3